MAKKKNGSSFPWLTAIGVGIAGVALYEIFFAGKPSVTVSVPSAPAPAGSLPAASAPTPESPQAKLQDYGQKYQSIREDIDVINAQLSNRQISAQQYQDSKNVLMNDITQAFLDGRITTTDSMALKGRFTA